jgi:hypothetical protein
MSELRRSTRNLRRVYYAEGLPVTVVKSLTRLDQQSFPAAVYAAVDDVLVFSLFATKNHASSYRALRPTPLSSSPRPVSDEVGVDVKKICDEYISRSHPTLEQCANASARLAGAYPALIQQDEVKIAQQ